MTAIATSRSLEWLQFQPSNPRGEVFLAALANAAAAGGSAHKTQTYRGQSDLLVLWGPGSPLRWPAMRAQLAAGKHVICADLAYWSRDQKIRLSIDAAHPQAWVLRRDWPAARFLADPVRLEHTFDPSGPIVMAGIGAKAAVQYGEQVERWEAAQVARCHALWPQRRIWYRRKRGQGTIANGTTAASEGPIDQVLRGASLVVTWHSNVAIDAMRLGIPVVCRDGAAAAVYPSEITADLAPLDPALRQCYLQNLAWFQWSASEAPACWHWLQELLG